MDSPISMRAVQAQQLDVRFLRRLASRYRAEADRIDAILAGTRDAALEAAADDLEEVRVLLARVRGASGYGSGRAGIDRASLLLQLGDDEPITIPPEVAGRSRTSNVISFARPSIRRA